MTNDVTEKLELFQPMHYLSHRPINHDQSIPIEVPNQSHTPHRVCEIIEVGPINGVVFSFVVFTIFHHISSIFPPSKQYPERNSVRDEEFEE